MLSVQDRSPLEIKNLSVKYGDFFAVKSLNLKLNKGEIFGLLGPNGAGKTSTISTIVTLEKASEGEIWILDAMVQQDPVRAKSYIGYVPQEIINHGYFSVNEILQFHSGYFGRLKNQERIDYLLHKLGLWEHKHKKVKQLSGGMKRRLLIAKALVHEPALVLLDEPTAGVDIELRSSLWDFVKELKEQGTTILLTTHYLEEAEALCDRVGVIYKGELLTIDKTQDLIQKLTHRRVWVKLSRALPELQDEYLVSQTADELCFSLPSSRELGDLLKSLGEGVAYISDIHIDEGSLEDAFLNILHSNVQDSGSSLTAVNGSGNLTTMGTHQGGDHV